MDKRDEWAQFRFMVIAPLVCRTLTAEARNALRKEILAQAYEAPGDKVIRVPERTLRAWLERYRKAGLDGLKCTTRSTLGSSKAIPTDMLKKAQELRLEEPRRSVRQILKLLKVYGFETEGVSRSTLNMQLNRLGATKENVSSDRGNFQRWEQPLVNMLWQADTSHGPWIRDPARPGEKRKTKLVSFIDDASRVCVHAEFYWDEKLPTLVDCFRKALLKRVKPERVLADNAFIYHSKTFSNMCSGLGIETSYCKKYSPEGKGKIEKHFGVIKAAFYKEANHADVMTLEELNAFFFAWLTKEYHHAEHSSLYGLSPIERWRKDEERVVQFTPDQLRKALKLRTERKVNYNH